MTQKPRGVDIFHLEELLSPEELQIRDSVRTFVADEVMPIVGENWRLGKFPVELAKRMGKLGILGGHLDFPDSPKISMMAAGLVHLELERGDTGIRSFASVQGCLVMKAILKYGSEEQQKRWLPALASGEAIGAFAMTEPDHGSDPNNMTTKATKSGDYYIIHGSKTWITNGSIADVVIVWARCEGELRAFLVERGTTGFSSNDIPGKHSMRMSVTSELSFDECAVPKENLLPEAKGLKSCLKLLNDARYAIAWGAVGAAEACLEQALEYVSTRVQFGKPLAAFQMVQNKIADMVTELTGAKLTAYHLGRLEESGSMMHHHVSIAKRGNVRATINVARMARDLLGANGICDEYAPFRHMANLEAQATIEGTEHIHALIIGQSLTGYASYT